MRQVLMIRPVSQIRFLPMLLLCLCAAISCDNQQAVPLPAASQQSPAREQERRHQRPARSAARKPVVQKPRSQNSPKSEPVVSAWGQTSPVGGELPDEDTVTVADPGNGSAAYGGFPRPVIDQRQAEAAGVRLIQSRHLALYTDLPSAPDVDLLPAIFDLAIEPWCHYFEIDPNTVSSWKMICYLIRDPERFRQLNLLTGDLPPFKNGYQRGWEIWIYAQPSAYYQRHMLLHEGTHAFMSWHLHGCGPPWYMEGTAELLGTHRWGEGHLELGFFPRSRQEVELWGRTRIVKDEVAAGRAMSLDQIMKYGPTAHIDNAPYGWCWAAAAFLDGHPEFQERFRQLPDHVRDDPRGFRRFFDTLYEPDKRRLVEQWQLFIAHLDYGYDLVREAIIYRPSVELPANGAEFTVRSDRGWQSIGVRVKPGVTYSLIAQGRYQIAQQPEVWWCEPGGVTIEYFQGRPLGMLMAAVSDQSNSSAGPTPLLHPVEIGLRREITFAEPGTLFLRINDSPTALADNSGQLEVTVKELSESSPN